MAHHKRRRRRRAGIQGCCGACMLRSTDGTRNGRVLTRAESHAAVSDAEQRVEAGERPLPRPPRHR